MKKSVAVFLLSVMSVGSLHAALFEDDEARKAILDLRQRVEALRTDTEKANQAVVQDSAGLGKSLLDLQRQLELSLAAWGLGLHADIQLMDFEAAKLCVECVSEFLAGHSPRKFCGFARYRARIHCVDARLQLRAQIVFGNYVEHSRLDFGKALTGIQLQLFLRHGGLRLLICGGLKCLGLLN